MATNPRKTGSVKELSLLFLKLGTIAFGGPAAHIAMMEEEVVHRRRWLSKEKFLDLLGAANLIPGPSSTELAIYIGYLQAGWIGLLLAGVCFILPAAIIVTALAWAYVQYGSLPQAIGILYGVKPVIIAVILQALWSLGRTAVKTRFLAVVGLAAFTLSFLGVNPLIVIFGFGSITGLGRWIFVQKNKERPTRLSLILLLVTPLLAYVVQTAASTTYATPSSIGPWPIFLIFLKIGSVVFGSGYVLLAFLRGDLVVHLHWLTDSQLINAVAVGQVTPGPVFTTATFIGYLLAGPYGAFVATTGIFIPAFVLVALSGPLIPRIRQSKIAGAFLDGVTVASLSLMAFVTYELGRVALVDIVTIVLAIASAILLIRFRLNSGWLVFLGATVGLLTFVLR
ncbi:MAG: chromate efflux transporter [Candidatus Bathyarchaeia archaeon]|jgi:chromate transporter